MGFFEPEQLLRDSVLRHQVVPDAIFCILFVSTGWFKGPLLAREWSGPNGPFVTPVSRSTIAHESTKPTPGGRAAVRTCPVGLLDRLAAFIVPPRTRNPSFQRVLAPDSRLGQDDK